MRVVVLFAPAFFAFGKAFIKDMKARYKNVEIIGLAATRPVYEKLLADESCDFLVLECIEDEEHEWMATPYDEAELKSYEEVFGAQVINNILITDRLVGAGFVSGADFFDAELSRRVLKNDAVMRAYMTGCIRYFNDLYERLRPDAAFLYAIAGAHPCALADILRAKGALVYRLQHSRIEDRYLVDDSMTGGLALVWQRFEKREKSGAEGWKMAQGWLADFRAKSGLEPDYMQIIRNDMRKRISWKGLFREIARSFARMILYPVVKGRKLLHAKSGRQQFWEALILPVKLWYEQRPKNFIAVDEIGRRPFIYFPLHLDPEASTMHLAPDYTDQVAVIEALAKRKPLHMDIIVKENPHMLGRRPWGYHRRIRNLPGVRMVDIAMPGMELIKKCEMVFTITGTTAWEAALMGKPAVIMGDVPFGLFKSGMVYCESLSHIPQALEKVKTIKPLSDDEILRFVSLVYEESFPFSSILFWSEATEQQVQGNMQMIHDMVDQFMRRCREKGLEAKAA